MMSSEERIVVERIALSLAQNLNLRKGFLVHQENKTMFFVWLSEHTKRHVDEGSFVDDIKKWLLETYTTVDDVVEAALTIQTEIIWTKYNKLEGRTK